MFEEPDRAVGHEPGRPAATHGMGNALGCALCSVLARQRLRRLTDQKGSGA